MPHGVLIIGGGIAGACAALWLSDHYEVTLVEAGRPATGASGAAAGLVNPFMARRANPAWRWAEALAALRETLERAGAPDLFRRAGLLRPAADAEQARHFRQRAEAFPAHLGWLEHGAAAERLPDVRAPHGALWVGDGGHVPVGEAVMAIVRAAERRDVQVVTGQHVVGWREEGEGVIVETAAGASFTAGLVLLAVGDGFGAFPALAALPLHRVKGQTVTVARPAGLGPIPTLSGSGYVVPEGDALVVGGSYEHAFESVEPDPAVSATLVARAAEMVPALAGAPVVEARAGVRVTVPRTVSPQRLPLLGPLPGHRRAWAFVGLGSKGLLTAPLLARDLPRYLRDPEALPPEVRLLAR